MSAGVCAGSPGLRGVSSYKASPWSLHCSHTDYLLPIHAPSSGLSRRPFLPFCTSLILNHSSAQVLLEKAHRASPLDLANEVRPSPVKHGCHSPFLTPVSLAVTVQLFSAGRSLPPHRELPESSLWVCSCPAFVSLGRAPLWVLNRSVTQGNAYSGEGCRMIYHYFVHLSFIT